MSFYTELSPLTADEIQAARAYAKDSRYHHALAQTDRYADKDPDYLSFMQRAKATVPPLSSAVNKFELTQAMTVFSGFGRGLAAIGSLHADPLDRFVGLTYRYEGFVSTSTSRAKAEEFAAKDWRFDSERPILLVITLPVGFKCFPMEALGADCTHEREILLGRGTPLEIIGAQHVNIAGLTVPTLELTVRA